MKKLKLFLALLVFCGSIDAQVEVKSNGNLAIGNPWNINASINVLVNDKSAIRVTEQYPFNYGAITAAIATNPTTRANVVTLAIPGVGEFQNFYVEGSGNVWAKGQLVSGSDISFKEDIRKIESPLDKILKLRGITYQNKLKPKIPFVFNEDDNFDMWKDVSKKPTPEVEKQIYAEIEMPRIGFIAQEVEKVIPEVVKTQTDGTKGIAYMELIAVLVEAIKEQQGTLNELKQKVEKREENTPVVSLRSYTEENTTNDLQDAVVAQCKLYQNTPNPFNQDTQIKYFIPENVGVAQLCIYNLQGTQIKQILITQRGEGSQWISGSELVAGIYLYALIVDGKEVDTKRMILTK